MAGRPYDYVALVPIFFGGSRAYNPGDPVPADNVETHGYKVGEQVAEYGTPEARQVTGQPDDRDDESAGTASVPSTSGPAAALSAQPAAPASPAEPDKAPADKAAGKRASKS